MKNEAMKNKTFTKYLILFGISVLLLTSGILLISLNSVFNEIILTNTFVLAPNSVAYGAWVKNPLPLTLKVYLFNWTNPDQLSNGDGNYYKPDFRQMGPYTFLETKEKAGLIWNYENGTVTYKNLKKWWFDPENSNGSLSDLVTSVNPVALASAYSARSWSYLVKKGLSMTLATMIDRVETTKTVGQVLFEGYNDPLLTLASQMTFLDKKNMPTMDKFGWFYGRNGSEDYEGSFNVDTGAKGRIGRLYSWKYQENTPYYPGKCGSFEGASAGEFFPRKLTKDSVVKFFSADLCRYVELEFEKEEVVAGILGYKFSAGKKFLDNGTEIRENRCFCDGNCMPSGALNVSACRYGSPAFVSLPHFYKADPYYLDNVQGVQPSDRHNFFMTFEPETGLPLRVAARLQLNLLMLPIDDISLYSAVPKVFVPVLWFEQVVAIPGSMAFTFRLLLNFRVICWAMGVILMTSAAVISILTCYRMCTTNLFGKKKCELPREEVPLK